MIPGRKYTVGSIGHLVWSRRRLIVASILIGAVASWSYARRLVDAYQSQATILVLPQQVPQNFVRSTVTQDLEEQLRGLRESVLSSDRIMQMATELSLYPELGSDAAAILQRFQSRLGIQIARADAFRVMFVHRDPALAAAVTDRVSRAFVEGGRQARTGLAQETDRFIEDQLDSTRERLAEHEQRLAAYRQAYSGQLPTQMDSNLQVIQNAQNRLRALDDSIRVDRDQKLRTDQALAALTTVEEESQPADAAPDIDFESVPESALTLRGRDARRQIPVARATLEKMELQLKAEHPDIVRLKRVIAQLERRVATELGEGALSAGARIDAARARRADQLRAEIAELDKRLAAKDAEHAQVRDVIARYQQRVEMMPTRETELTTLMRDYDTLRETYRGLLTKKEETQMAAELERRQVGETMKIVEPARTPGRPFSPDRPRIVFSGTVFCLALALAFTVWREARDRTIRTRSEVLAALQLPVLAQIPIITSAAELRSAHRRQTALMGGAVVLVAAGFWVLYMKFVGGR